MPIGAAKNYKGTSNEEINQIIHKNFKNIKVENKSKRSGPAKYIRINNCIYLYFKT